MRKFVFLLLSGVAVALLGACGSRQPAPVVVVPPSPPVVTTAPAPITPVVMPAKALQPGFGRIESMTSIPTAASAGSTAPATMSRLNIRMDDGSMQVVDTPSAGLAVGDQVELTRDGYIRRLPPTS